MRFVGFLLFALGAGGVGICVRGVFVRPRPMDVVLALAAPAAALVALMGLALLFVPGFLG